MTTRIEPTSGGPTLWLVAWPGGWATFASLTDAEEFLDRNERMLAQIPKPPHQETVQER